MGSFNVHVLGREMTFLGDTSNYASVFRRIKKRVRDEEGIPVRFQAVGLDQYTDDTFHVRLHGFKQIRRVDPNHVHQILEMMPKARRWFSQRERATVMALSSDTWISDELHIKTYVALRHWCWVNGYDFVDDPINTHDEQHQGTLCQQVDGILPRWVDHCSCELD